MCDTQIIYFPFALCLVAETEAGRADREKFSRGVVPWLCTVTTDNSLSLYSTWLRIKPGGRRPRYPACSGNEIFQMVRIIMRVALSILLVHCEGAIRVLSEALPTKQHTWDTGKEMLATNQRYRLWGKKWKRGLHLKHGAVKYQWRRNMRDAGQREVEFHPQPPGHDFIN